MKGTNVRLEYSPERLGPRRVTSASHGCHIQTARWQFHWDGVGLRPGCVQWCGGCAGILAWEMQPRME